MFEDGARVGDDDLRSLHLGESRRKRGAVGHIGDEPARAESLSDLRRPLGFKVENPDVRAAFGQQARTGQPDAVGAAGDHCGLSSEFDRHSPTV